MAYDLFSKKQTATDWSMGGYGFPTQAWGRQPQWGGRQQQQRRRRHRHRQPGQPGQPGQTWQPGQPWTGTPAAAPPPGAPPPALPPPGYPYMEYPYAQPQPAAPAPGPQPTIDVFVGNALRAGVPVHAVQKALVKKGYDPRQIATIVNRAR